MSHEKSNSNVHLLIAAVAAFGTYFCMYAFRKPFTAATFEGQEVYGLGLKAMLVIAQLAGYMLSKFIGIKVVSEMSARYRGIAILGLIAAAEIALVGFAYAPVGWKPVMLFFNGLPLGMIFGLVLAYLEGRRATEALSAALCASFIISSGVVKSIGRWLIQNQGWSEFQMPMITGLMFLPPLFVCVWLLQATPPPDPHDVKLRTERKAMNHQERKRFFSEFWPGLSLLLFVYIALTVIRTIRDDFSVEIWRDMGVSKTPDVYARSELLVAVCVTAFNALAIWIAHNLTAMRVTISTMCLAFGLIVGSAWAQSTGWVSPFPFMVLCGVGMYVPYVAFHTTVFERLIAAAKRPSNLGFLMYLADAVGYLGYAVVLVWRSTTSPPKEILPFFQVSLTIVSVSSTVALIGALVYFQIVLTSDPENEQLNLSEELVPAK